MCLAFFHVQAADRFNINRQWEHLQAKYVGTGHADTTKLCVSLIAAKLVDRSFLTTVAVSLLLQ